jgi:hypothetical protein
MKNHDTCCQRPKVKNPYLQMLVSIPWCCVTSIILILISLFSSFIPLAGISVLDTFFHKFLLIPAMLLHIYGIIWYIKFDHHKTARKNKMYIALSILFVASLVFHVSDIHDTIFAHN